jgi:hypothetical protein
MHSRSSHKIPPPKRTESLALADRETNNRPVLRGDLTGKLEPHSGSGQRFSRQQQSGALLKFWLDLT